jgi:hypothetical protein
MNVFGKTPVSEQGYCFRRTVWEWEPLWQYCEELAPDLIPADNLGHANDGWGLDEPGALLLADRLAQALDSGKAQQHEEHHTARLMALRPEPCMLCGGTGYRAKPPRRGPGTLPCARCGGKGLVANSATDFSFSVENVRAFVAFLWGCGGFRIF